MLRALLLQVHYTIRSERMLIEQLDYNLLFSWFVGLSMDDDKVWDHSTFSKNRDSLIVYDAATAFFRTIKVQAERAGLLSNKTFTVDCTLIEAWASMKIFRPKDKDNRDPHSSGRNVECNFKGQKRKKDTHQSTTDLNCRLSRKGKGKESKLCFMGHDVVRL